MRIPLIVGNWKMFKTGQEAVDFLIRLNGLVENLRGVEIVVCPSFTVLYRVAQVLATSKVALGAQNMHWEEEGAYTGEVSPPMLKEVGCKYVILGHSERRTLFQETDQMVNKKIKAAFSRGLTPLVCVGETLEERQGGKTNELISEQIKISLDGLGPEELKGLVVAYEPVWAIGTGHTASTDMAQEVNNMIRNLLVKIAGREVADSIRILYGGSVNPGNIASFMVQPDLDGALVGGASLQADTFTAIIKGALSAKRICDEL